MGLAKIEISSSIASAQATASREIAKLHEVDSSIPMSWQKTVLADNIIQHTNSTVTKRHCVIHYHIGNDPDKQVEVILQMVRGVRLGGFEFWSAEYVTISTSDGKFIMSYSLEPFDPQTKLDLLTLGEYPFSDIKE